MKTLLAPTEDFIKIASSKLAATATAGTSVVITLQNTDGFLVNDFAAIGWEGSEQGELCQITAVTGETITVATLKLSHLQDEPIRKYLYNARKFYGCATVSGFYVELTGYGSPMAIAVDDPQGSYLEYTGSEGYIYFKSTYFNTTTSSESDIANANAVLANDSGRYCSIYAIRKQAGLTNNPFVTDERIEINRKRAENEVNSYINSKYIIPLVNTLGVAEVPFMIENCTTLLAAGYIDYQEFGADGQGVKWLGESRAILKNLQKPGGQQLIGSDNMEMQTRPLSNGVHSFPDKVDDCNGPAQYFTMGQRF